VRRGRPDGLRSPDGGRSEGDLDADEDEPERGEAAEAGEDVQLPERERRRDDERRDGPGERAVEEVREDAVGGPVGAGRDDLSEGEGPVGDREAGARVPDDRAEEDLDVCRAGGPDREAGGAGEERGVRGDARRRFREAAPEERGAERDRRREREDDLREARVRRGDRGRRRKRTVSPPRTACARIAPKAARPSRNVVRSVRRKPRTRICRPTIVATVAAIIRWPCSKRIPPTIGGISFP
jgi:hypothetical protein